LTTTSKQSCAHLFSSCRTTAHFKLVKCGLYKLLMRMTGPEAAAAARSANWKSQI